MSEDWERYWIREAKVLGALTESRKTIQELKSELNFSDYKVRSTLDALKVRGLVRGRWEGKKMYWSKQ